MEKRNPRLDLQAVIDGKLQRVEIPQYALKYPNFNRIPLAAVKTDIYNPEMATFTQNQNDDFHCRLSYENARSNTTLNHGTNLIFRGIFDKQDQATYYHYFL